MTRQPNTLALQQTTIQQYCQILRLPTVSAQFAKMAEEAVREQQSHLEYLEALLAAEREDRDQRQVQRRLRDTHIPRMKTLEEFDF